MIYLFSNHRESTKAYSLCLFHFQALFMALMIYRPFIFFYSFIFISCEDITHDVFGDSTHLLPAAFGDFDSDKLTDVFVIEKKKEEYFVQVLKSHSLPPLLRPTDPLCIFKQHVISLVPSDFDGDGAMDVLVITYDPGTSKEPEMLYRGYVLWGDLSTLECPIKDSPLLLLRSQPLLMDYNGDMIADLFGEDDSGKRVFWVFGKERNVGPTKIPLLEHNSLDLASLKLSGGHAFVDLNKDLAADLWLVTKNSFELWLSSDNYETYQEIKPPTLNGDYPKVIGQSAFLDIDLDGNLELLIPICFVHHCDNSQLYVYEFTNSSNDWYNLNINLIDEKEVKWHFSSDTSYLYTQTITPRIGDFNLDGYPDVLITLFNAKKEPRVVLLINTECEESGCSYPRTLVPNWDVLEPWKSTVLGTFFDFNEDGNLDILVVNASADGKSYTSLAYQNSVEYDAVFVKVLVLTGQCYHDCQNKNIPYGTNIPGPSMAYAITTSTGGMQESCATQLSQSSHFVLQLPFTVFGLGRNWNFVDRLDVGVPIFIDNLINGSSLIEESIRKRTFTQIIPNSQMVVIPYPLDNPNGWTTKLFITPSKSVLITVGAFTATCLLVTFIIGGLHFKERKEDRKERLQEAQRFHFDAM